MERPEYMGQKVDRTSNELWLCYECSLLATHQARIEDGKLIHLCVEHMTERIRSKGTKRIKALPKYQLFLHQFAKWETEANDTSESML